MKLLRSLYRLVRVILGLGLGLQLQPNDLLTMTSIVNLNLYNPKPFALENGSWERFTDKLGTLKEGVTIQICIESYNGYFLIL